MRFFQFLTRGNKVSGYRLGKTSKSKLKGVHPDLVAVVERAIEITEQDFSVIEGLRTLDRQRYLLNKGATTTMNSRHLTGHAVDLAPYPYDGDIDMDGILNGYDWDTYFPIADAMIKASKELDVPLRWGGMWQVHDLRKWHGTAKHLHSKYKGSFPDGPHFELPRKHYSE